MRNKRNLFIALLMACMLLVGGAGDVFAAGSLSIAVSSSTVAAGDTMTVTVYAADANNTDVTADMNITYDAGKLEYISSSSGNASGGGGTVKATGSTVEITFKAIGSGDAYVKAEGATLTAAGTHINVSGTAASNKNSNSGTDTAADTTSTVKSGDNSLSSLKISSGSLSPAFKPNITQYTAAVGSDVNEITVTPVTSNSKATVESVTGNTGLKSGQNVITVLVKAENGTEAAYKITVTKGDTVAASSDSTKTENDSRTDADSTADTTEKTEDTDTQAAAGSTGDIVIDGVNYSISEAFSDSQIPEGFKRADFEYKGAPYQGVVFEYGHLGMYYLVNEASEGRFFVYDADRDGFYPYVRMTSENHYILLMVVPNGAIPPDNYEETTLTLSDGTAVQAYRYKGNPNDEIVNIPAGDSSDGTETLDNTAAAALGSDFYIFYGMDDTGVSGWYQYDSVQGTYQRLNEEAMAATEDTRDYDTLLESYNELSDRYKTTRKKDRRLIAVLIFVSVVFLILMINLILKLRESGDDDDDDDDGDESEEKQPKRKKERVSAVRREKPVKEYKKITEEESDYYEDDEDFMDEFEEDPGILRKRPAKKEKAVSLRREAKETREIQSPKRTEEETDNDDIEFLDLNDL